MRNVFFIVAIVLLTTACSSTSKRSDISALDGSLKRGAHVLIATPAPGSFGQEAYPASGAATALAVREAFLGYSDTVMISRECRDVQCLDRYAANPDTYLVVPEILRWEDRSTTWSGKPDQVEIRMSIYSAISRRKLAESVVYGVSSSMTLLAGTPEELLPEALGSYVASLY